MRNTVCEGESLRINLPIRWVGNDDEQTLGGEGGLLVARSRGEFVLCV